MNRVYPEVPSQVNEEPVYQQVANVLSSPGFLEQNSALEKSPVFNIYGIKVNEVQLEVLKLVLGFVPQHSIMRLRRALKCYFFPAR